jgi:hypothetical protein
MGKSKMIERGHRNGDATNARVPEARYAYYRRCQVFKRNGVQCNAPAEKGAQICHAHAGQLAMAVRRERDRRAVLAEAVAEMRKRGKPECEMADLFADFKGIQVTTAVMARAVITGRIDCKTAGQMVVHLQTLSKLLRQIHRRKTSTTEARRHGELWKSYPGPSFAVKAPLIQDDSLKRGEFAPRSFITPQICADERRLKTKNLPLINTDNTDLKKLPNPGTLPRINADGADRKKSHVGKNFNVTFSKHRPLALLDGGSRILPFKLSAFGERCRAHGPPEANAA